MYLLKSPSAQNECAAFTSIDWLLCCVIDQCHVMCSWRSATRAHCRVVWSHFVGEKGWLTVAAGWWCVIWLEAESCSVSTLHDDTWLTVNSLITRSTRGRKIPARRHTAKDIVVVHAGDSSPTLIACTCCFSWIPLVPMCPVICNILSKIHTWNFIGNFLGEENDWTKK